MTFTKYNSLKLDIFIKFYIYPMLIRVHIIQGQFIQAPVFSEARFFRVPVFLGSSFSGTSFLRVQVKIFQGPCPSFRSSQTKYRVTEVQSKFSFKTKPKKEEKEEKLWKLSISFCLTDCLKFLYILPLFKYITKMGSKVIRGTGQTHKWHQLLCILSR